MIESEGMVKIHIHTIQPDIIIDKIREFPQAEINVEEIKVEAQESKKKPLGLVVDQASDLPRDFLKNHDIEEISYKIRFPGGKKIDSTEEL